MYFAVQVIDIAYGNEHRGAPDSSRRASLPRGVPLPHHDGESVLHDCRLTAWSEYMPLAMVSGVPMQQGFAVARRPWMPRRRTD